MSTPPAHRSPRSRRRRPRSRLIWQWSLSRPLFIYPKADVLKRAEGLAFIEFYIANTDKIAEQALFVPLTQEQKDKLRAQLAELKEASGQ